MLQALRIGISLPSVTVRSLGAGALWGALLLSAAFRLDAAGFAFSDQSAEALALGGAFVAQADDPTAIYYNPGGLALLEKKKAVSAGLAVATFNEALYQGLPPGIGVGTASEQKTALGLVPHAFLTLPVGGRMVAGVGVFSPFRLRTDWNDPGSFAGRFLATDARIDTYDLAPTLGIQVTPKLGIGVGAIYRTSEIQASRRIAAQVGGQSTDVASLSLDTDLEPGYGWSLGVLHKPGPKLSWGFSYRSAIETEYLGTGALTQILTGDEQLDDLLAAGFPFGQDLALSSELQFPSTATLGVAWSPSRAILLELDVTQTGWSDLQEIAFRFGSERTLDTRYRLGFDDTLTWRTGARYRFPTGPQVRVGYAFDESPQPDTTVGAFLADSDRNTLSVGFGLDWLDVGFAWTTWDQRITSVSVDRLNGNYRANAWTFAMTVTK